MYERLYNIQNGDVWGGWIMDFVAPQGKENITANNGFSTHEEDKYKGKSTFLTEFYTGTERRGIY